MKLSLKEISGDHPHQGTGKRKLKFESHCFKGILLVPVMYMPLTLAVHFMLLEERKRKKRNML